MFRTRMTEPFMRIWIAGAALILAGCATPDSGAKSSDANCSEGASTMTAYATCLDRTEEPAWRKGAPENFTSYQAFAATRLDLAKELDASKITQAQFRDGAAAALAKFHSSLDSSRKAEDEAQARRAQDDLDILRREMPPDDGTNPMGKNNM